MSSLQKKILVVGSGAREHALSTRLLAAPSVGEVLVLPGNAGTARARVKAGKVLRNVAGSVLDVARAERVDLVVIGPEGPICEGLADDLWTLGIRTFGPSRQAARLEASKAFMKEFAERHSIPTGRYRILRDAAEVSAGVREFATPPVIKADGLCAGKGVVVAESFEQAEEAALAMLVGNRFGPAGHTVVLEERIPGLEASVHALCDGDSFILLPAAQDHKRLQDGDRGPNTGGMGAYAPAPLISPSLERRIYHEIIERAVRGMATEGTPFRGVLFAGVMITPEGQPVLLEFNVRFGDPEAVVLGAVTDGDWGEALAGAALGQLDFAALQASARSAVSVVLAAHGYPENPRRGDVINGVEAAESIPGVEVFHAGTAFDAGRLVTAGGRVLTVTAQASDLALARELAYRAVEQIQFDGMQYRRDIAARA